MGIHVPQAGVLLGRGLPVFNWFEVFVFDDFDGLPAPFSLGVDVVVFWCDECTAESA